MKRRGERPILITDAERSQEDQLRTRTIRYVAMMMLRLVSLIAAAILITVRPPLLGLWLGLCAVCMIIVPWAAVVLANDRLPKEKHRWRRHHGGTPAAQSLPEAPAGDRVIEAEQRRPS